MGAIFPPSKTYRRSPAKRRPVSTSPVKHHKQREESIQMRACTYLRKNYPHVIFICDYAAGLNLTDNQRIKMMQQRSEDGQPDISIFFPSRGYHGLVIELKKDGTVIYRKDGKLRKQPYTRKYRKNGKLYIKKGDHLAEQAATLMKYNRLGYLGRFAVGFESFTKIVDWYMGQERLFGDEVLYHDI